MSKKTDNEVGARNVRKLAAAFYNTSSGFENIVGVVDRIMQLLEVKDADYKLRPNNNEMFFPGRSCELIVNDRKIGDVGVVHPEVINNFELNCPCSVVEIDLQYFDETFVKYD